MMYPTLFLRPKGISMKRSQVIEALDTIPDAALLGAAHKELTPKQRKFAREVAKGATKAEAYRKSYKATAAPSTLRNEPYALAAHPGVAREIEVYKAALEAQEYRTPAALRALIVQTLTQTILDPGVAPAVRVQAARVLGTITEVSAFTHRTETTVIKRSDDAKLELLNQLKTMMRTVDESGNSDAEALLTELAGPHRGGEAPDAVVTHRGSIHSIPHSESSNNSDSQISDESQKLASATPPPADMEDPPVDVEQK